MVVVEEEKNRNVVLMDGKQLKCGVGGGSGMKIKIWQGAKYLKRRKGAGASKTLRLVIGKTIEMWWWCREGKEKIEAGEGGGGEITELWRRRKGTGVSKKW